MRLGLDVTDVMAIQIASEGTLPILVPTSSKTENNSCVGHDSHFELCRARPEGIDCVMEKMWSMKYAHFFFPDIPF